ncbi:uncharacterized protein [Euphorbia lathyris]|uniref:uncharacterized protein isoform X1 n=1 Tax=Euphorbia lathyris TaxID=212925 RepID=UPI00331373B3
MEREGKSAKVPTKKTDRKEATRLAREQAESNVQPQTLRATAISRKVGAPFAILNEDEAKRFEDVSRSPCQPFCYFDKEFLIEKDLLVPFMAKLESLGWKDMANARTLVYPSLVEEFYTSLTGTDEDNERWLHFRLAGRPFSKDSKWVKDTLKCQKTNGECKWPPGHTPEQFWKQITGSDNFNLSNLRSSMIRDPILYLLYKFVAYMFCGKAETNKVNERELHALFCSENDIECDIVFIVEESMKAMNKKKRSGLGSGHWVTIFAEKLLPNVSFVGLASLSPKPIGASLLKGLKLGEAGSSSQAPEPQHEENGEEHREEEAAGGSVGGAPQGMYQEADFNQHPGFLQILAHLDTIEAHNAESRQLIQRGYDLAQQSYEMAQRNDEAANRNTLMLQQLLDNQAQDRANAQAFYANFDCFAQSYSNQFGFDWPPPRPPPPQ